MLIWTGDSVSSLLGLVSFRLLRLAALHFDFYHLLISMNGFNYALSLKLYILISNWLIWCYMINLLFLLSLKCFHLQQIQIPSYPHTHAKTYSGKFFNLHLINWTWIFLYNSSFGIVHEPFECNHLVSIDFFFYIKIFYEKL